MNNKGFVKETKEESLIKLFEDWADEKALNFSPLPESGSYREYYRISGPGKVAIGAYNSDRKENRAFLGFSKYFFNLGLPVPEIYTADEEKKVYLEQDLGNITLYAWLTEVRKQSGFTGEITGVYKEIIEELIRFQVAGVKGIDYKLCYPRANFDKQSMLWDMHYFKYYFLKLAKIPFDEQNLEDDFQSLADFLLEADCNYFLYRDFQSRNVMLLKGKPYFIDYQGGRKGALQYDLASLLYDAKAEIPELIREKLLDYYIKDINKVIRVEPDIFRHYYYGYVFIRIMQALGTYGFRGFYERKNHFLQSIPFAVKNLDYLLSSIDLPLKIPALKNAFQQLIRSERLVNITRQNSKKLTVSVNSFSYQRGIPVDVTGHGGGFVFDCRAVNNPGRLEKFQHLTGMDKEVKNFLDNEKEMKEFLENTKKLVDQTVKKYQERNFANLMVSYGCTGGQHRSVYAADKMAEHLKEKYDINVIVQHHGQDFLLP
jgi:aminoglycoside/choline kinase family phosphotransferase